jgi:hypothetical protein
LFLRNKKSSREEKVRGREAGRGTERKRSVRGREKGGGTGEERKR